MRVLFFLLIAHLYLPAECLAQASYVARFALEKPSYLLGEPIFCDFTIQNTGPRPFTFSYRSPARVWGGEVGQEPRFVVTGERGTAVADPTPRPCGGAAGSIVYGSVTLPPAQKHTERWLLNQWARISRPGRYHVRADRRLPLFVVNPGDQADSQRPAAFAMAMDELAFDVLLSTEAQLQTIFQPYLKVLAEGSESSVAEAVAVVTTLPQPFLLPTLKAMVNAPPEQRRWDRKQAVEGLARLGTRPAWELIAKTARGEDLPGVEEGAGSVNESLRAYAVLLLGEKADAAFLPALLSMVSSSSEELRGDILRALGYYHDPRANQALFEQLRSPSASDRANAILGLKNLESTEAIPALLAMLNDPEHQVRQVAHFALESLTGIKFKLSSSASRAEFAHVTEEWHAWWRANAASFTPVRQPPCRDW